MGLENAITGITIIALGTSLPDTFASRTAALNEQYADASIGNVTGQLSLSLNNRSHPLENGVLFCVKRTFIVFKFCNMQKTCADFT